LVGQLFTMRFPKDRRLEEVRQCHLCFVGALATCVLLVRWPPFFPIEKSQRISLIHSPIPMASPYGFYPFFVLQARRLLVSHKPVTVYMPAAQMKYVCGFVGLVGEGSGRPHAFSFSQHIDERGKNK
jgi:hypothetical protein